MWIGVAYGIAACMLWGFIYLVPLVLPQYDAILLASGRYISFGLVALPLLWVDWDEFKQYSARDWFDVTMLGLFGNIVYYWFLTTSISHAGAPLAGMCMALIPVLICVLANWRDRRQGAGVSWIKVVPGIGLIASGLILANWTEFDYVINALQKSGWDFWYGVGTGVIALLIWTWYPIRNADWLLAHPGRSPKAWATAQGITTLPVALLIYFFVWLSMPEGAPLLGETPQWFVFVMLLSGLGGSWLGVACWNAMSQKLPTALGGQMIVFETIFAVIYAHALRMQWPSLTMCLGMTLLIGGVLVSIRTFENQSVT